MFNTSHATSSSDLPFIGPSIVIYSYNKSQRVVINSQIYFGKELSIFRTDLLSIIRSLNNVYTTMGICHTSYVDCLLGRSGS